MSMTKEDAALWNGCLFIVVEQMQQDYRLTRGVIVNRPNKKRYAAGITQNFWATKNGGKFPEDAAMSPDVVNQLEYEVETGLRGINGARIVSYEIVPISDLQGVNLMPEFFVTRPVVWGIKFEFPRPYLHKVWQVAANLDQSIGKLIYEVGFEMDKDKFPFIEHS